MKEFIMNLPVQGRAIIVTVIAVVLVWAIIRKMKEATLEDMRECAYKAFLKAERMFKEPGSGEEKMEWVVQAVKLAIPVTMRPWFSDEFIRKTLQVWFELVKDLLDDGKEKWKEVE